MERQGQGSQGFPTTCSASWCKREMFITRVCSLIASVSCRWGRSQVSQKSWGEEEEEEVEVQRAGGEEWMSETERRASLEEMKGYFNWVSESSLIPLSY